MAYAVSDEELASYSDEQFEKVLPKLGQPGIRRAQIHKYVKKHMAIQSHSGERRIVAGGDFLCDKPKLTPVWGEGNDVLWAEGEGFMIVADQGLGKSTIAQQLVFARLGLHNGKFLGYDVKPTDRPILYLAMDRPRQIQRGMARMVRPEDRAFLNERLMVQWGPLPFSVLEEPSALADFAEEVCPGVGTIVIDSVKDLATNLSDGEVGAGLNLSWQEVIARGIDLCLLHHQRKVGADANTELSLDSVYGSAWLTRGLGSIIALSGKTGQPDATMTHLKPAANIVSPLLIETDHTTGITSATAKVTIEVALDEAAEDGLTVQTLADKTSMTEKRVRSRLNKLLEGGKVVKEQGQRSGKGASPDIWILKKYSQLALLDTLNKES